jgi:hypothetical protein
VIGGAEGRRLAAEASCCVSRTPKRMAAIIGLRETIPLEAALATLNVPPPLKSAGVPASCL